MRFVGRLGGGGFKKNISAHYNSYMCEHLFIVYESI